LTHYFLSNFGQPSAVTKNPLISGASDPKKYQPSKDKLKKE
jgi:hypothetical protein